MSTENEILSEDDLSNIKIAAAEEASRVTAGLFDGDAEDLDDEVANDFEEEEDEVIPARRIKRTVDDIKNQVADQDSFDVFENIGEELASEGIFCKYVIYKSGKLLTHEDHPYSWELLQKDRGEGIYKVIAKDQHNKYIKAQTKAIATLTDKAGQELSPRKEANDKNGVGALDMIALMNATTKEAREESRREAKEAREQFQNLLVALKPDSKGNDQMMQMMMNNSKENMNMLTTLVTALQPKDTSNDTTKMMMDMQTNTNNMMMEMQKNTMSVIEKMNDKFEKGLDRVMAASSTPEPEPEFNAYSVMKLVSDAEERAERRSREFYDLAEAKATEKAEQLSGKPSGTLTDTLLKSLAPVAAMMMGPKPSTSEAAPAARPAPKRVAPPKKRPANRPAAKRPTRKKAPSVLDYIDKVEDNTEPDNIETVINVENRDAIVAVAFPLLGQSIQAGKTIEDTVALVVAELEEKGFDLETVERDVTPETIDELITVYSMPEDFQKLLREFYVKLINATREKTRKSANG